MNELLLIVIVVAGGIILRSYNQRLQKLESHIRELQNAVAGRTPAGETTESLEAVLGTDDVSPPIDASPAASTDGEQAAEKESEAPLAARAEPALADEPSVTPPQMAGRGETLESKIGARWAVWVGGVALAFGGIFLVKYSIESGLLGPGVRLVLAALFGLALIVAGEFIRRRSEPMLANMFQNAMIPGVLTAAGVVALFGATYAAHGIYGFIGPAVAFVLLASIALATLGLSLLHGQALAGVGLIASMVTPALIASTSPKPWTLFGYLVLTWLATSAASRLRRWHLVPSLANACLSLWALLYLENSYPPDLTPLTLSILAMIAGVIFLWPGNYEPLAGQTGKSDAPTQTGTSSKVGMAREWIAPLARPPLGMTLTASIGAVAVALTLLANSVFNGGSLPNAPLAFAAIIAALASFGASRPHAAWATIIAAAAAIAGEVLLTGLSLPSLLGSPGIADAPIASVSNMYTGLCLGAVFVVVGCFFLRRHGRVEIPLAALWSIVMAVTPLAIAVISYVSLGNWNRDWLHGFYGIGLGIILIAVGGWQHRSSRDEAAIPTNILIGGSFAAFVFALHTLAHDSAPTILLPVIGMAYLLAGRVRGWPVLPWTMVAALLLVLGRIAWQPTIVDADQLGKTPIFNALLAGYGIPAALAVWAAFDVRHSSSLRLRSSLQALASFLVLLTIAILVRHAMNGGVLTASAPTLGEQSIYTLLAIGASATLMALDLSASSPVFRYGSMAIGILSVISIMALHLAGLNPFLTGESTGRIPFFNLLLLGYLLPALAYGGVALHARSRRPPPYVMMLAVAGAVMAFAWATLSVRRLWQGEYIPFWNGFIQGETYTYSVVWLLIGIALLVLGARLNARSLRIASAALVLVAVVKVFLIDMAHLEGFLRALSFIGLGGVLIGIGLFYQKVLTRKKATD